MIDDLAPRQREVQDAEGHTYAMWARPYRTTENRIDGVVISMFDVTERKQSAEARYRRLFEASPDGIVIADAQTGEILDMNPFVAKVFGYPKARLLGQRFWDSPLFTGTVIDESIRIRLRETESLQMPVSMQAESGDPVEAEVVCSTYEEGGSQVIQFNLRDLTARKRREEQWRREEVQSQQANRMEAIGRLAGGVAHDFNNMLMAILGFCDLLSGEIGDNPKTAPLLAQIRRSGERAVLVTRQLLAFGRKQIVKPELLDLSQVTQEMRQLIQVTLPPSVELALDPSQEACRARADRGQLEQVVLNLALNARDALPSGGRISVSTANVTVDTAFSERHPAVPAGHYATLTVQDNGVGMDSETLSHMFEPFFTTKPKGVGTGLGLSAVYSIVRHAGGHIWAYSELGIGTKFMVYLPRVTGEVPAEVNAPATEGDSRGDETVLVVEDEPAVRNLALLLLEQRGYRVLEASGGREALQVAASYAGRIHLLLTDVMMPQMSGRELAFLLASRRPDMKVIYMSGHTEDAISHHGVLDEGVAFLQKPFTSQQLALKIRELLEEPEAKPNRETVKE